MANSLPVQRLTDDALWARVGRQARCASGLDPDQPDRRVRNDRAAAIPPVPSGLVQGGDAQ